MEFSYELYNVPNYELDGTENLIIDFNNIEDAKEELGTLQNRKRNIWLIKCLSGLYIEVIAT